MKSPLFEWLKKSRFWPTLEAVMNTDVAKSIQQSSLSQDVDPTNESGKLVVIRGRGNTTPYHIYELPCSIILPGKQ